MTNQQRMCELTAEDFYAKMMWLLHSYGMRYTHTQLAVIDWLKSDEHFEDDKYIIFKRSDELAEEAQAAVNANHGYCPCMFEKTEDTKCPCKDFREKDEECICECGLYQKTYASPKGYVSI